MSPDASHDLYIQSQIAFMKEVDSLDALTTRSLPITSTDGQDSIKGYLVPVGLTHAADSRTLELLTTWRAENEMAFPTRFVVTTTGTREWLQNSVLQNPNRLLFLISDPFMRPLGHIGVLRRDDAKLELDNVVRGSKDFPGIMSGSVLALENWVRDQLNIHTLELRVLRSNTRAMRFYERLGYQEQHRQGLKWEQDSDGMVLKPADSGLDDEFVTMRKSLEEHLPPQDKIPTAGPIVGPREATYVLDAVRRGWNDQSSKYIRALEEEFAQYVGARYAIATSSCTGALHLALSACGLGPGDEVLVPETTWVATGAAISYTGATPVFIDVDIDSWTLDLELMKAALTPRTRAIVPVHLYGFPASMERIREFANLHSLKVIEDAAPAIGASSNGRKVGAIGDAGCFSFQGAKLLVAGEGGILVTNNEQIYTEALRLNDHGRIPGTFVINTLGHKYKMNNVTAALALGQLHSVDILRAKKTWVFDSYTELLADVPGISFQKELPHSSSIFWMTSLVLGPEVKGDASGLSSYLRLKHVDTRPVFPPQSSFSIWTSPSKALRSPTIAQTLGQRALNLPSGAGMSYASIKKVADLVREYVHMNAE